MHAFFVIAPVNQDASQIGLWFPFNYENAVNNSHPTSGHCALCHFADGQVHFSLEGTRDTSPSIEASLVRQEFLYWLFTGITAGKI